ncbi:MAG: peptidoglycan DD-metalloendopeptidase family protein [Elusimicrobia bacterium]|nr:peptidoglycan DD-metalloendopeptidase family protein [Elusimicrobiota bacterium]
MSNKKYSKNITILAFTVLFVCFLIALFNKDVILQIKPLVIISSGTIKTGDVLAKILTEEKVSGSEADKIVYALNRKYRVRNIQPGKKYEIFKSTSGEVFQFNYWHTPIEYFNVRKINDNKFFCEKITLKAKKVLTKIQGKIKSSLYEALQEKGVPDEIIMTIADIFSWQIDFFNDPRSGDKFKLVYNRYEYGDELVDDGEILAVQYNGNYTGNHTAVRFQSKDGKINSYYTPDGESLTKIFLKAPLEYRRISSHFTNSRFHPILRYYRPHRGIDYAAPSGTPVSSIGDGVVTYAGWNGDYGNFVRIKHNSVYTSAYGHLHAIAKGVRKGKHVKQKQVIGWVGTTGLSTGPHLDFRITKNGKFVNFLTLKIPSAKNLPKEYKNEFKAVKDEMTAMFESIGK